MSYYPAQYVWRYNSKIDPRVERASADRALEYDLHRAAEIVGNFTPTGLLGAVVDAPPDLKAALEVLAEYAKSPTKIDADELPF